MKKILGIVFLGLLCFNTSFAQSLKPLQTYIDENADTINDPVVVSYMLKRCGAIYIFASAITKDKNEDQAEIFGKASNEAILNAGRILIEKLEWSEDEASKNLRIEVTKMVEYYKKDGTDFFARMGLYMKDNYIGDDLFICKKIMEKFR